MKRTWIIGLAVLLFLVGCSGQRALPPEEAAAFAGQVDEMSENLLTALNNQDYAAYIRDMSAEMLAVSSEEQFTQVYTAIIGVLGVYESRTMSQVLEQGRYRTVVYTATFANEENVTVRVVYDVSTDPPRIAGLWFDSLLLREQ